MTISKKLFIAQTVLLTLAVGYLGSVAVTSSARIHDLETTSASPQVDSVHERRDDFSLTGSPTEVASVVLTVPEGVTRAAVTVTGSVNLLNEQPSGWGLLRIELDVGGRPEFPQTTAVEAQRYESAEFTSSEVFEGLSPGQHLVVRVRVVFLSPHAYTTANLTATAMFLP